MTSDTERILQAFAEVTRRLTAVEHSIVDNNSGLDSINNATDKRIQSLGRGIAAAEQQVLPQSTMSCAPTNLNALFNTRFDTVLGDTLAYEFEHGTQQAPGTPAGFLNSVTGTPQRRATSELPPPADTPHNPFMTAPLGGVDLLPSSINIIPSQVCDTMSASVIMPDSPVITSEEVTQMLLGPINLCSGPPVLPHVDNKIHLPVTEEQHQEHCNTCPPCTFQPSRCLYFDFSDSPIYHALTESKRASQN